MNPFDDDNDNNDNNDNIQETKDSTNVNIWVEINGSKKNTYITGWNIPESQLKDHLKMIKKKNGCNGTLKEISNDGNKSDITKVIQLQGDLIDYMKNYLINNNIDSYIIKVLGQ